MDPINHRRQYHEYLQFVNFPTRSPGSSPQVKYFAVGCMEKRNRSHLNLRRTSNSKKATSKKVFKFQLYFLNPLLIRNFRFISNFFPGARFRMKTSASDRFINLIKWIQEIFCMFQSNIFPFLLNIPKKNYIT